MAQDFAAQLGNLVLNDSNWRPVNVMDNLTSGIPPSGNLQYWNSTLGNSNYTYLRYSHEIANPVAEAATALDYYFRPNTFSYAAYCTYPISGQYGFLNRLLFYLLMIFALVERRHIWLAAAALGTAMTYAANAAVHAFALLARYRYSMSLSNQDIDHPQAAKASDYGDLDLQGIFPILVAGCVMLTPILNWSIAIRENARAVTVCWGALMFAAVIPSFWKVLEGITPLVDSDQLVTCAVNATKNCTLDHLLQNNDYISYDFYDNCNCNDTCSTVSLPHAPFRKGQGLQAYLTSDTIIKLEYTDAVRSAGFVDALFLCFIIGHGILGLLEVTVTQAELRNKIFRVLGGQASYRDRAGFVSKARYYIAKAIASFSFLLAIAAAIISPAVFISSVVINEINVWSYPVSEKEDAVGQWSTYVSAAFVLMAAVIQRYHLQWQDALLDTIEKAKRLTWPKRDIAPKSTQQNQSKNSRVLAFVGDFFVQCARPLEYVDESVRQSSRRVRDVWEDFRLWWRDPINRSRQQQYRPLTPSTEMLPFQGSTMHIGRSATTPQISSSLAMQSLKRPTAAASLLSESSLSPQMPANSRLTSPQPVGGGHSYFDDPGSMRDPVQRHTFERRASAV